MQGALEGVRVLDLTEGVAGPFGTRLLADLGAEVVKVERPPAGDPARRWGPFPEDRPGRERSGFFAFLNFNKRGITLDYTTPTGARLLRALARTADLLVEDRPPGLLASLGLGWEDLRKENPRLVVASLTPFGQDGPYRGAPWDEITLYGMGGPLYSTGVRDREPVRVAPWVPLFQAGALLALAAVTALWQAEATGEGDWLDLSLYEALAGSQDRRTPYLMAYQHTGEVVRRRTPGMTLASGIKPCADGYISLVGFGIRFPRLAQAIGRPDALEDPRFADPASQADPEHIRAFDEEYLLPWLARHTRREAWEVLQRHEILSGPLFTVADLLEDPHFTGRGVWADLDQPGLGPVRIPGRPFLAPALGWAVRRPAPRLGEHNGEVLGDLLGLGPAEQVRLRQMGVI